MSHAARTCCSGRRSRSAEYASEVNPQRRTALLSVLAAIALIGLKLGTGIATHSLGLLSEAAHSGTDARELHRNVAINEHWLSSSASDQLAVTRPGA